jgi:hypothetical protein
MDAYYAAGGPRDVDVVTFHSYRSDPDAVVQDVEKMRAVALKYGLSAKPLWDTEGSWGTAKLSDAEQAGFVSRYYLLQWSMNVSRFYWYAWDEPQWGTLWERTNGPRRAAAAYEQTYNWMVGAELVRKCSMATDSTWTCALKRASSRELLVVWNSKREASYKPPKQYTKYVDLAGNPHAIDGALAIGYAPVLLMASHDQLPPLTNPAFK